MAARELLDRCLGKPKLSVEMDLEVTQPSFDFSQLSDVELARMISEGGFTIPPVLQRKVKLIESKAAPPPPAG
jgi:hypothetical protein